MRFSVIIPAHNEAEFLPRALEGLREQTVPRAEYEIIVVNNNSTDATVRVAREYGADKVLEETQKGTNFARQRGVRAAQGRILAFLDADCLPPPDWLEYFERRLSEPGVVAVSGVYDLGLKGVSQLASRLFTHLLVLAVGLLPFVFWEKAGAIIGGNFAAWHWAIDKIGGLPPLRFWGDDAATAMLLSRKVGKVIFDPHLIVKNSPRRWERDGFLRLQWQYIRAYLRVYFMDERTYALLNKQSTKTLSQHQGFSSPPSKKSVKIRQAE